MEMYFSFGLSSPGLSSHSSSATVNIHPELTLYNSTFIYDQFNLRDYAYIREEDLHLLLDGVRKAEREENYFLMVVVSFA